MVRTILLVVAHAAAVAASGGAACAGFSAESLTAAGSYGLFSEPGVTAHCITGDRCFFAYVPPKVSNGASMPLLASLHGGMSCAELRKFYDGSVMWANAKGAAVIWPQAKGMPWSAIGGAMGSSWNAGGGCCGPQASSDVDDVEFVRQAIDVFRSTIVPAIAGRSLTVDGTKIYMSGHSMGCALAQRFLTLHSDYIAAMSCSSMVAWVDLPAPGPAVTPTPVLIVHGYLDTDIPFAGRSGPPQPGPVEWNDLDYPWALTSAVDNIKAFGAMMGCANSSVTSNATQWPTPLPTSFLAYDGVSCNAGVSVQLQVNGACGHEAYKDFPGGVSTASDVAAGVKPCTVDTNAAAYALFDGSVSAAAAPVAASLTSVTANFPSAGCDGGCVGGIIGGCFVPTLMFILWMSGVFGPKCPSPLKKKKKDADVVMTSTVDASKAEEASKDKV